MSDSWKIVSGIAVAGFAAIILFHVIVGAEILSLLLDSVCMVFPVCPKD